MDFRPVKTIAVDFDGVLHDFEKGWCGGKIVGKPLPNSRESINKLIEKGYDVVILTAREDFEPVHKWLRKYKFPKLKVTNVKPPAIAYIDDRGIRFTNWIDITNYFI